MVLGVTVFLIDLGTTDLRMVLGVTVFLIDLGTTELRMVLGVTVFLIDLGTTVLRMVLGVTDFLIDLGTTVRIFFRSGTILRGGLCFFKCSFLAPSRLYAIASLMASSPRYIG